MYSQNPTHGKILQILGQYPPLGNPMATEAECQQYCDQLKFLKNQHDSFFNIGCALHRALKKAIQDQFKTVQQIKFCGFRNCTTWEIVDRLFHADGHATATDTFKINDTIKTPGTPTNHLKCPSSSLKMSESLPSVQILATAYRVSSCTHWISSLIKVFLEKNTVTSTTKQHSWN